MNQMYGVLLFLGVVMSNLVAQNGHDNSILQAYIDQALKSNLALQQKEFSLQKSVAALDEAVGLFLPSISIEARYSRADGGRMIEFPVGDLMNPVYQSLNEILTNMGQPAKPFPILENEQIPFLREKEHDTKLRVIQPLFQPKLIYNYKIQRRLKTISELDLAVYRKRLKADVKKAYYNFLKAGELVDLLKETKVLLLENLRVSQSLLKNQMITKDGVLRSEAEIASLEYEQTQARHNRDLARSYFNFLLNRSFDKAIELDRSDYSAIMSSMPEGNFVQLALSGREEIVQLKEALSISQYQKQVHTSNYLPDLNVVGDFGYQGGAYQFDKEHDYWMVNGLLSWNLFRGFSDRAQAQQANIETESLKKKLEELKLQIELQVQKAESNCQSTKGQLVAATKQLASAAEAFRLVRKQYEQGTLPMIRFLDARNAMTAARVRQVVARYDLLIRRAELEYVVGRDLP